MRAAIFDMDGTLADVSSIRHHVLTHPKNFDAFHSESAGVPTHPWVVDEARALHAEGVAILVVTARKEKWRRHTEWFLALNDIPSDGLWMRDDWDDRRDIEVKRDILDKIIKLGFEPVVAFDDNPAVIGLWQSHGIPTTIVPGWETTGAGEGKPNG